MKKHYKLIAADLSKQKVLDADSRAIQQIIFTGKIKTTVSNTKIKGNNISISERNNKSSVININGWI